MDSVGATGGGGSGSGATTGRGETFKAEAGGGASSLLEDLMGGLSLPGFAALDLVQPGGAGAEAVSDFVR